MKIFKYMALALAAVVTMGCVQEYMEVDPDKVPSASELQVKISVDNETNYVTFSVENEGVVPMWIFGDEKIDGKANKKYAYTGNGLKLRLRDAGEHSVEVKAYNAHGVSVGSRTETFTLENTYRDPFDPSKYITFFAGNESKTWEWNSTVKGHFGCGEPDTDGTNWWSCGVNEKADWGLYDDRLTFTKDMKYTYNPGEGGMVYVNKDSGYGTEYNTNDGNDYMVPIEGFTVDYSFENAWNDAGIEEIYLVLPQNANLSYIPNSDAMADPCYKLLEGTNTKKLALVHDNGAISWKYEFVIEGSVKPEEPAPGPGEVVFDPNSERNMWLNAVTTDHHFWFANNDWGQIDNATVTSNGNYHEFVLPEGIGGQQWQGQFFFQNTGLATSAAKTYDFYCVLNADADHAGVTVKLCAQDDDGAIITDGRYALTAFEDYVVKVVAAPGIDCENLKLVFDFGGGQGGSTVVVKDIVFRESKGAVTPDPEPETPSFDPNAGTNLWLSMNVEEMFYYYAPGWAQIDNPETTVNGNSLTVTLPEATTDQWQAQVAFRTDLSSSADKKYDFYCVVNSTQDLPGMTIKLVMTGDDNVFYFADKHVITAYEDYVYCVQGMDGIDMEKISLFFDFGGNPAGTEVTIKDIVFREAVEGGNAGGGSDETVLDPTSPDNMWLSMNVEEMFYYYAPGWTQIDNPETEVDGNTLKVTLPEATTDQWQAQVAFRTDISSQAGKKYDFYCVVNSTQDLPGMTIKLTKTGDDNTFYFADKHVITAYEDYVYKVVGMDGIDMEKISLFFDFGGNPAGTEVTISDILFQEHK